MKKNDYEKSLKIMQELKDLSDYENEILFNRLYVLQKFIKKWGKTLPNGKQEICCYRCVDVLNNIIKGDIKEEYLK